jgi:hypothetical protein
MYRLFISHARAEFGEAKERKDWLVQQDRPPANDILFDGDMVRPAPHSIDGLNPAMKNSDAVVCAMSDSWVGGPERIAGFRTAEYLHNRVLCARPQSRPQMRWARPGDAQTGSEMLNQQRLPSKTTGLRKPKWH